MVIPGLHPGRHFPENRENNREFYQNVIQKGMMVSLFDFVKINIS
jgi:hypothetical protein